MLPGTDLPSAIQKQPVAGALFMGRLGLTGDEQADLVHHGGPDKAVHVYSSDRFPYWEEAFGTTLGPGAFGENLTVAGLTEADVQIGDIYRMGEALVQVCQPRVPCNKVNLKFGRTDVLQRIIETGYSGYYLRVLQEGHVQAGDLVTLVERNPAAPTVLLCNQVRFHQPENREAMQRLLETPAFAEAWLNGLRKRLAAAQP